MIVAIIDANGVKQASNEVTESIPLDLLMAAASVTCELHNRDNHDDKWEVNEIDDTTEA